VGKVSTHPEKVETNTKRYLHTWALAFHWSPWLSLQEEFHQHSGHKGALLSLFQDCFWHIRYISDILS
jgi:hypothetical protein